MGVSHGIGSNKTPSRPCKFEISGKLSQADLSEGVIAIGDTPFSKLSTSKEHFVFGMEYE